MGLGRDGPGEKAIEFATTVEIIHTASLVHDDIVDGAPVRRGVEALHARWGGGRRAPRRRPSLSYAVAKADEARRETESCLEGLSVPLRLCVAESGGRGQDDTANSDG